MGVRQVGCCPAKRSAVEKTVVRFAAAWLGERAAARAVVAGLVLLGFGWSATSAAASGASPDPAPQASPAANSGSPAPDPAPVASPTDSTGSATSTQTTAPVVPHATSSGIGVASSSSHATQTPSVRTTQSAPAIRASPVIRRPARAAATRANRQPHRVPVVMHHLANPWRLNWFSPTGVAARAVTSPRNGLLLLFGAIALAVLALASGSMLRLLRRMEARPR